jgi:hypothetical protein
MVLLSSISEAGAAPETGASRLSTVVDDADEERIATPRALVKHII